MAVVRADIRQVDRYLDGTVKGKKRKEKERKGMERNGKEWKRVDVN